MLLLNIGNMRIRSELISMEMVYTRFSTIEAIGDVHLALGDNKHSGDTKYYIVDGSNDPIGLTKARPRKRSNSDGGWSATQVECKRERRL